MIVKQNIIKKITHKIVKKLRPEKIVLFGSFAWGKPKQDSDIDLFVVKETNDPWKTTYEIRNQLDDFHESFDIVVYTSKQVKKRLELGDQFVKDILGKGKVLYEKSN